MTNYIIETDKFTKEFKNDGTPLFNKRKVLCAVKNVDLKIERGEFFCLIGPNGAGKTTLLKMLCGLIIPTSGSAKIAGHDVGRDIGKIKPLIGVASFTDNSFFGRLTAIQNLELFAALYNLRPADAKNEIRRLSELLGIDREMNILFQNLSAGAKQKLSIARALLNSPELLFLDEPMKSLDRKTSAVLWEYLKKITGKDHKTVFCITHNFEEAEGLFSTRAIMNMGEIEICRKSSQVPGLTEKVVGKGFEYAAS